MTFIPKYAFRGRKQIIETVTFITKNMIRMMIPPTRQRRPKKRPFEAD